MSKNTFMWTLITAVLSAFVYIDILYLWTIFFVTIPLAVLAAIISMIVAYKAKQSVYIYVNLLFAVIAVLSIIVIPW